MATVIPVQWWCAAPAPENQLRPRDAHQPAVISFNLLTGRGARRREWRRMRLETPRARSQGIKMRLREGGGRKHELVSVRAPPERTSSANTPRRHFIWSRARALRSGAGRAERLRKHARGETLTHRWVPVSQWIWSRFPPNSMKMSPRGGGGARLGE